MSPQKQEIDLVELRTQIIYAVEQLSPNHNRVSAEMMKKFVEMRTGETYTLSQIGNNLRILKKKGILSEKRIRGHRYWSVTGRRYDAKGDEIHRALIAFPKTMYDRISKFAALAGLSRTAFVTNMVGIGLESLEPLRESGELSPGEEVE
jgi:hypothetical protein